MSYPTGETVVILDGTATGSDAYGTDTRTFPVKATYGSCPVWPTDSNEAVDGRDTVTAGLSVALPADALVSAVDRAVVRGATWEVAGMPQPVGSPWTGWQPGVVVTLERVTG